MVWILLRKHPPDTFPFLHTLQAQYTQKWCSMRQNRINLPNLYPENLNYNHDYHPLTYFIWTYIQHCIYLIHIFVGYIAHRHTYHTKNKRTPIKLINRSYSKCLSILSFRISILFSNATSWSINPSSIIYIYSFLICVRSFTPNSIYVGIICLSIDWAILNCRYHFAGYKKKSNKFQDPFSFPIYGCVYVNGIAFNVILLTLLYAIT